jgi:CRISPR-associated protein Cmr3
MKTWLILPRDPLIFRNGKPFTAAPGSRSETLPMPFPSTLAGAVRTMSGTNPKTGKFDKGQIESLLEKTIVGPILVRLDIGGGIDDFLLPAPSDAVMFRVEDPAQAKCVDLQPIKIEDSQVDLKDLKVCGPSVLVKEKPHPKPPAFWKWETFYTWLRHPETKTVRLSEIGIPALPQEIRTHVGIDRKTQVAEDGALFQTSGLEFTHQESPESDDYDLTTAKAFGIIVTTDATLNDGVNHLGGERRIVKWQAVDRALPMQDCPDELKKTILENNYCRLILITPAFFEKGFLPDWLEKTFDVQVEAVVNKRYQGVSGWDYDKCKPKPTRRLTPAGSVYFLKLPEDEEKRKAFIDQVWMKTISDDDQLRRDGFGLALLGVWDGQDREMKMEVEK